MNMTRGFHPSRRTRLRFTLLAILALLCQQVAFAAYVCPTPAMPAIGTVSADCSAMRMTTPRADTGNATTACVLQYAQSATVTNNLQLPSVPPLLLPAVLPSPLLLAPLVTVRATHARDEAERPPGLPPPLRYRVLLI